MRIIFPSVLNILQSLAAFFAVPAVNQKANHGLDVQADAMDQYNADKDLDSSESDGDFGAPRWAYRGHYRSIFPPRF